MDSTILYAYEKHYQRAISFPSFKKNFEKYFRPKVIQQILVVRNHGKIMGTKNN